MNAVIASDRPIKAVNADVTILEDARHNPFCLSKFLSRPASAMDLIENYKRLQAELKEQASKHGPLAP
jgi:hypothetical protein